MNGIKAVVDRSKEDQKGLLEENEKEKFRLNKELKILQSKLTKSQKTVEELNDSQVKRLGTLKTKLSETESVKNELARCTEIHQKALRTKDVQYARDKNKWAVIEQRLRDELNESKIASSHYSGKHESLTELRALVENLKAEKSALQLKIVSGNDTTNRRIVQLEKALSQSSAVTPNTSQDLRRTTQTRTTSIAPAKSKYLQSSRSFSYDEDKSLGKEVREPAETPRTKNITNTSRNRHSIPELSATKSSIKSISKPSNNVNLHDAEEEIDAEGMSTSVRQSRSSMRKHIRNRKFG